MTYVAINGTIPPHLNSMRASAKNMHSHIAIQEMSDLRYPATKKTSTFSNKDSANTLSSIMSAVRRLRCKYNNLFSFYKIAQKKRARRARKSLKNLTPENYILKLSATCVCFCEVRGGSFCGPS